MSKRSNTRTNSATGTRKHTPAPTKTGTKTGSRRQRPGGQTSTRPAGGEMVSPLSGAVCPTGAHPGNTGGKPGRSGRPPNELRELFRTVLDDGIDLVRDVIQGCATIVLNRVCEHCGKESTGPESIDDLLASVPTVDNRLRAVDTAAKYGLGERSEFSEDVVSQNVDAMLTAARSLMSEQDFTHFCRRADEIWNAGSRSHANA